ncbi:UDP-N-acetylmuramoyl-tripeptide--D-alanyl-D-alanine ligase [Virgibacillus sp. LDC-1]|uniref:UDP-N-acetylmuramoyl-tripeptide--D-alanyl-D- alanine ligase n=1 Tax=Virgibacillus sp. LDC-1 TaxID=3039856 RepID=UPI0024DE306E|nr:UDP-N-acetylmuramoyl-tripeptide--D-alanyl-D-alanine ligase [Virgibacillus sp. LDC-1]
MLFTTQWIASVFENYRGEAQSAIPINAVSTDSRENASHSLFIPLVGEKFDGHDYIKQAFNNGAVAAIWNKDKALPRFLPTDFPVFLVEDTDLALQKLAAAYRDLVDPVVIGVTGSNGKTTTKEMVAAIASTSYKTHFTQGNFNNHIGLPLTILSMTRDTELLVLEMGMNHFGEIERLTKISKPDYAVITNIGESHIEFLGSREGIAKAKLEIRLGLKQNGCLIIDGDEPLLNHVKKDDNVLTCGLESENDVVLSDVTISNTQTSFKLSDNYSYSIPLLGVHNAKNASYAIAVGRKLNIGQEQIEKALATLPPTSMRMEITRGASGVAIINDTYNASPTSMVAAIEVIKQMTGYKNKVLVLGDIFELGDKAKQLHQSVAASIEPPITVLYTVGKEAEIISKTVCKQQPNMLCAHFQSKEDLLGELHEYLMHDTLVLFKASRGMQFETMVKAIQS